MPDFAVVGGGLAGMLAARELAMAGASVVLVERGELGREASWAGAGILDLLLPWEHPEPVQALADCARVAWPHLAETLRQDTGIDPQYDVTGMILLGRAATLAAEWGANRPGRALRSVERDFLSRREPALAEDLARAVWMPDAACIRNPRLCKALAADLARRPGVELMPGVEVEGFVTEGDRVLGLRLARGVLAAGQVVVAAGAWSGTLLATLGLRLPVHPVRGQMLLYEAADLGISTLLVQDDHYLVPRRDGLLLMGASVEEVGFDASTTDAVGKTLAADAVRLLPALAGRAPRAHWAGLRPGSPGGVPFIGPVAGWQGLSLNTGHFRSGIALAPTSARLLADLLLDRPAEVDATAFAFPRSEP